MKVILLKDVPKIGRKDQILEVNQGHAVNFLIPRKLARAASSSDVKNIQNKNEIQKKNSEEQTKKGRDTLKALHNEVVKISEKANEKGHLFSKVQLDEIIKAAIEQTGVSIQKEWVKNFDQIKSVGEFEIILEAFGEKATLLLNISNR